MSYLALAKQARARQSASLRPFSEAASAAHADELNELTKKSARPQPVDITSALRAAYRRWFTLAVAEADCRPVEPLEVQALHQQILRLTDDAGPCWADAVYADELRRFQTEAGRCGLCGGLGHPDGEEDR